MYTVIYKTQDEYMGYCPSQRRDKMGYLLLSLTFPDPLHRQPSKDWSNWGNGGNLLPLSTFTLKLLSEKNKPMKPETVCWTPLRNAHILAECTDKRIELDQFFWPPPFSKQDIKNFFKLKFLWKSMKTSRLNGRPLGWSRSVCSSLLLGAACVDLPHPPQNP